MMSTKAAKKSHSVYVVELSRSVWSESRKFRAANPTYKGMSTCLYVGMTSLKPKQRLEKHLTGARSKKGHKISSKFVEKYGMYLRPSLYEHFNPLTRERAYQLEKDLTDSLRKRGFAVWSN